MTTHEPIKIRTAFISDLHLGSKTCNAAAILSFLHNYDFEKLYLVGDIIDFWALDRKKYWPQLHNDVIQKILKKARKGCEVVYLFGNHSQIISNYCGSYGNITIKETDIHTTAAGERIAIFHGHQVDIIIRNAKFLAFAGDIGYHILMECNSIINFLRKIVGRNHWSLSKFCKSKVKEVVSFIGDYEANIVKYAEQFDCGSVLTGHIHHPAIKIVKATTSSEGTRGRARETTYYNCGDFVESCSAIVEHLNGDMELIYIKN